MVNNIHFKNCENQFIMDSDKLAPVVNSPKSTSLNQYFIENSEKNSVSLDKSCKEIFPKFDNAI